MPMRKYQNRANKKNQKYSYQDEPPHVADDDQGRKTGSYTRSGKQKRSKRMAEVFQPPSED